MEITDFADEYGPEKVVEVYDPLTGMKGFTVIDNTALGPAKGGIRMTPSVDVKEVFRLARAMTWKNSLADLPFGGGKSGIIWEKKDAAKKLDFIKSFGKSLRGIAPQMYVAAPDVNTSEKEMEYFVKANGEFNSATGKPMSFSKIVKGKKVHGLPHELGSTGLGVFYATDVTLKHQNMDMKGTTIAIEGFGNVGSFAFQYLEKAGAKIVAISDSKGCLYNPEGLKYEEVKTVKEETGTVTNGKGKKLVGSELFELPVDVLIPAAMPDVINIKNMDKVKAKVIIEAANIPIPLDVEAKLSKKVLIVPDFVANAGGVISSYVEYIGKGEDYMRKLVQEKIVKNTSLVLKNASKKGISPREAAMDIAASRVKAAMKKRAKK